MHILHFYFVEQNWQCYSQFRLFTIIPSLEAKQAIFFSFLFFFSLLRCSLPRKNTKGYKIFHKHYALLWIYVYALRHIILFHVMILFTKIHYAVYISTYTISLITVIQLLHFIFCNITKKLTYHNKAVQRRGLQHIYSYIYLQRQTHLVAALFLYIKNNYINTSRFVINNILHIEIT